MKFLSTALVNLVW